MCVHYYPLTECQRQCWNPNANCEAVNTRVGMFSSTGKLILPGLDWAYKDVKNKMVLLRVPT
eukprot:1160994-Pelagomonas_calceolata.AAC.15